MPQSIIARSISQHISQQLINRPFAARVQNSFKHACNLVTPNGDIVTLVTPKVGNGPLNIVLEGGGSCFAGITANTPARLDNGRLIIGDLQIVLTGALAWNPRPEWERLRGTYELVLSRLQLVTKSGYDYAPTASLLAMLGKPTTGNKLTKTILAAIQIAGENLQDGWSGDEEKLREAAGRLAGLGHGLTPAGDDFLIGTMFWAWLAHPNPGHFCDLLLQGATSRTTTLSAAFLRSAARGECDKWWQSMLVALGEGSAAEIDAATQMVLARGATSGADTLAGFLYLSPKWS